jgi:mannose-6-phosphate isomerase
MLYPLFFKPISKERLWGGRKLMDFLNKPFHENEIGESWELSAVSGDESVVSDGPLKGKQLNELIEIYKSDLVGKSVYQHFGNDFPVLIKYIDAQKDLSLQLHPHDHLAKERHASFGKNEMWYIMDADPGSQLIAGFSKNTDQNEYQHYLQNGKIEDILHYESVKRGDAFFIPTGTVHSIGAGILLAEIQQTSDVTYRIFDWNRTDIDGNTRELHTELALDAINFLKGDNHRVLYKVEPNKRSLMVDSPYFTTEIIAVQGETSIQTDQLDSFVVLMAVLGDNQILVDGTTYALPFGSTVLLPACLTGFTVQANQSEVLMVTI